MKDYSKKKKQRSKRPSKKSLGALPLWITSFMWEKMPKIMMQAGMSLRPRYMNINPAIINQTPGSVQKKLKYEKSNIPAKPPATFIE